MRFSVDYSLNGCYYSNTREIEEFSFCIKIPLAEQAKVDVNNHMSELHPPFLGSFDKEQWCVSHVFVLTELEQGKTISTDVNLTSLLSISLCKFISSILHVLDEGLLHILIFLARMSLSLLRSCCLFSLFHICFAAHSSQFSIILLYFWHIFL